MQFNLQDRHHASKGKFIFTLSALFLFHLETTLEIQTLKLCDSNFSSCFKEKNVVLTQLGAHTALI